jgi:hypothetical protein
MSWQHERARLGNLIARGRAPDDPEVIDARRAMRAEQLASKIQQTVDGWPPLSDEQRARLAVLLLTPSDEQRPSDELAGSG